MGWLRWLGCWWRGHDRIEGLCVACWRGAEGQRLRPISGGQWDAEFDPGGGLSDLAGSLSASEGGGGSWSSGLSDWASKLGAGLSKEFTDSPLKAFSGALGLGATGMGITNQFSTANQLAQQTKTIKQGQAQAQAAAAPAVAFGTETLNAAKGGQLTPALQAGIDQWVQKAKADARARMASMGLGNSTAITQLDQLIDQQAMAMKGQMLQQQEETGLAGVQTGVSAEQGVMGVSQNQQAMLMQLIQQANQALGQMAGKGA